MLYVYYHLTGVHIILALICTAVLGAVIAGLHMQNTVVIKTGEATVIHLYCPCI